MVIKMFFKPYQVCLLHIIKLTVILFCATVLYSSCSVSKPTYIFKDIVRDTVIQGFTDADVALKIQKNDVLSITISSLNPMEDALFNAAIGAAKGEGSGAGYLVNEDGNIYLHKLGPVMVRGMTRTTLKTKLETDLLPYLKDPIVTVNYANHYITLMGEVGGSKLLNMPADKISIIDAIAQTGNVTPNASLKNVMVVREIEGGKQFKHINLEDASIITSPWYYLQPKDILVMKTNEEKVYTEAKRARRMQLFTTFVSVLSITLIIFDRIFKR